MNNMSWDDANMQRICGQCHFKDEDPKLCHAIEPPIIKPFVPQDVSSCYYYPEARWKIHPQEWQDNELRLREERSKRYWNKNK